MHVFRDACSRSGLPTPTPASAGRGDPLTYFLLKLIKKNLYFNADLYGFIFYPAEIDQVPQFRYEAHPVILRAIAIFKGDAIPYFRAVVYEEVCGYVTQPID